MNSYQDDIARTWDDINECLVAKTKAISHEDFMRAKAGELKISLAGIKNVPNEWFPDLKGKDALALASGDAQQAPVFAAHGANVTITDYSDTQLVSEAYVAEREKYHINIVKADMSKAFPFWINRLI